MVTVSFGLGSELGLGLGMDYGCTQGGHAAGCRYFLSGCAFSKFRRQCSRASTYICSKDGSLLNVKGIPFCIGTVLSSFTSVHSIASPFVADILSNKVTFSSQPKYRYASTSERSTDSTSSRR